jgi:hypothetical protein
MTSRPIRKFSEEVYSHSLKRLLALADLEKKLERQSRDGDPQLGENWRIVTSWSEESRYKPADTAQAATLLGAIADGKYGVLKWIRQYW